MKFIDYLKKLNEAEDEKEEGNDKIDNEEPSDEEIKDPRDEENEQLEQRMKMIDKVVDKLIIDFDKIFKRNAEAIMKQIQDENIDGVINDFLINEAPKLLDENDVKILVFYQDEIFENFYEKIESEIIFKNEKEDK